jgi:hypothetical protein
MSANAQGDVQEPTHYERNPGPGAPLARAGGGGAPQRPRYARFKSSLSSSAAAVSDRTIDPVCST